MPFRAVGFPFEMSACDKGLIQILRVFDYGGDRKPIHAVTRMAIEVFRDDSIFAIRNSVLPEVSRLHASGYDFEAASAGLASLSPDELPRGNGISLPGCRPGWRLCFAKV